MRIKNIFIVPIFLLSGCSFLTSSSVEQSGVEAINLDIFAARGFLGGSDYERYVMKNGVLWRECGSVLPKPSSKKGAEPAGSNQNASGEAVLTGDPSLSIQQRRVEVLKPQDQAPVISAVKRLLAVEKHDLPAPESVFTLSDGGIFEFKLDSSFGTIHAVTNVDAVSDSDDEYRSGLSRVFTAIRAIGPTICRSETFFGLGKSK